MNDIDLHLLEMFKDQYFKQLNNIEYLIETLTQAQDYEENVNSLFRIFHNYKSSTAYLGLTTINALVVSVENTLEVIRSQEGPAEEEITLWLQEIYSQLLIWNEEMEDGKTDFSKAPYSLLNEVKVTTSSQSVAQRLTKLKIHYIDPKSQRAQKVVTALRKIAHDVDTSLSLEQKVLENKTDICIVNLGEETLETLDKYVDILPFSPLLVVVDKLSSRLISKLIFKGVNHYITNPLKFNDLKRELHNIANSHFSKRHVLINNKKIKKFIDHLAPLPTSLFEIQEICDDEESSLKDLINVVKHDPIITANILEATQNPIYGLKNIKTIDQAITIFGKKTVKAISFFCIYNNTGEINLDSYGINEIQFSQVAARRLSLMSKWYARIDKEELNTLSMSAILGNIGQLLLAAEIQESKKVDLFKEFAKESGFQMAEEKFFHTSTALVSSDVLKHWKINQDIVDAIRYSDNPYDAPLDIQHLSIANHIVFHTILLDGTIVKEIPSTLLTLMEDEGLNPTDFQEAVKSLT